MRGDFHSLDNEQTVQRDSSSGSSSPHSNLSHEDDVVEVNSTEFIPKPIYNFSIPDVIIHERENRRADRESRRQCNQNEQRIPGCRKRTHSSRNLNSDSGEGAVNGNVKRRRRAPAVGDNEDCHRASVFIDLTDIDSQDDEYHNAHSDSEVSSFSSRNETRYILVVFLNFAPILSSSTIVLSTISQVETKSTSMLFTYDTIVSLYCFGCK